MFHKPEDFVKKTVLSSFYLTTGIVFVFGAVLAKLDILLGVLYVVFPLIFIGMFFYMLKLPDVKISRKQREIEKEILFVTRHLIIELESGVAVFDAFLNVSRNYPVMGKYFREITNKVDMGTPLEDALNDTIEFTPSPNFRKILWQIINSMKTGAEVTRALSGVVDQIAREQLIEVEAYSKKLNPLAMFYMILAVIVPTLGTTMMIVFASFLSIEISLATLMVIVFFIAFFQFIFWGIVKASRPSMEL